MRSAVIYDNGKRKRLLICACRDCDGSREGEAIDTICEHRSGGWVFTTNPKYYDMSSKLKYAAVCPACWQEGMMSVEDKYYDKALDRIAALEAENKRLRSQIKQQDTETIPEGGG